MALDDINLTLIARKQTIAKICGPYRYKDGAFAAAVTNTTPLLNDLNTIISSPLLTAHEMSVFKRVKQSTIKLRNMQARRENPDNLQLMMESACVFDLEDVVAVDMKARGQYKPPMICQILGENGEVKESITINNDNKVERYEGGKLVNVPGAPEAFNRAQTEAFGEKLRMDGDCVLGCYADANLPSEEALTPSQGKAGVAPDHESECSSAKLAAEHIPVPKSKKIREFEGFGEAFEGNLKNVFL